MYIVAIGWLYVVLIIAATRDDLLAAVLTIVGYGVVPIAVLLWVAGSPRRGRLRRAAEQELHADDRQDSGGDH